MLISIIIPVYNVASYVEQCLRSVIDQTYRPLEVIIVDDCSTDNSMDVVERITADTPQDDSLTFKILRHTHNRGLSAARNTGLEAATGEYIGFVDSDDWIEPNMYETLYAELTADSKAILITSSIIAELPTGSIKGFAHTNNYKRGTWISPLEFLSRMISEETNNAVWNKLYRREFIQMPFFEGLNCEDYRFMFDNCSALINNDTHILTTDEIFCHYRIREGSITQNIHGDSPWYLDWMLQMCYVMDKCRLRLPEMYELQLKSFRKNYIAHFYSIVCNNSLAPANVKAFKSLNCYVQKMDKKGIPTILRIDIFTASCIPFGLKICRTYIPLRQSLAGKIRRFHKRLKHFSI